jgi:hypothetical protein
MGEVSGLERDKNIEAAYRRLADAIKRFPSQERILRNRQNSLRGDLYRNYKHEVKRSKPPRYSIQPAYGKQSALWSVDSVTYRIGKPPMSNSFHLGAYRRVGQRPRNEENLRRGWRATLLDCVWAMWRDDTGYPARSNWTTTPRHPSNRASRGG